MISRSVIEQALIPSSCGCARVSMMRGDVRSPGLVATEPDDQQGSPVDGQALDGSGAVLSIDGHRVFIPYAPSVPQALAERVEQAVQQATTAQEATNSTHVVAESAASTATAAVEAAAELSDAMEARDATIATIQDEVEAARSELAAAHGLASQASLDAAEANNAAVAAAEKAMAVALSGANLILNGGFEQVNAAGNPVEWPTPTSSLTYPETGSRSGTRHARFAPSSAAGAYSGQTFPASTGRSYYIEGHVKASALTDPATVQVGLVLRVRTAAGGSAHLYARVNPTSLSTTAWTRVSGTVTVSTADVVEATIAPHVSGAGMTGVAYLFDDLFAVDVTEAQSAIAAAEAAAQESADAVAAANSAITNVVPEYARNTSETTAPTSGWTENPPGRLPGTFIWRRDRITYGDSTTNTTPPVLTTGNTGPAGADGTSVAIKGRVATSSALPTTGVTDGDGYITEDTGHLWVRSGTTWIDAGLIRGPQGEAGSPGSPGADGVSVLTITPYYRRQLTSAAAPARPTTMSPPSGWVTTEPEWQPLNSLYRTERIVYSGGGFAWTLVTKVAAWEAAGQALTSANGKNARITRTAAPTSANTTNPVTGGELVTGDTWFQWDTTSSRNVIGQWTWDGSAWRREQIDSEVIANLDVNKLTVSGSAQVMQLDVVDKLISDAAHHRVLTAERLAIAPPTNMLAGVERWNTPGANANDKPWRNFGHNLDDPSMWAQGNGSVYVQQELEFTKGTRYRFEVDVRATVPDTRFYWELRMADNSLITWDDSKWVKGPGVTTHTNYPFSSQLVAGTGWNSYWVEGTALISGVARLRIYANHATGAPNPDGYQWFRNPRIRAMVGGVLIENGAITADKVTADLAMANKFSGLMATFGEAFIGKVKADFVDSGAFSGKLFTGGTFTGSTFRTAASGQRVQMDSTGLSRYRSDGEGGLIRSVNIGGSDADELALYDSEGRLLSGLMSDGSAAVRGQLAVGDLLVGGERFDAHLPRGILTAWRGIQNWHTAASSEIGIVQLRETIVAGRIYRFHFSGGFSGSQVNDLLALRVRVGSVGLDTNATVTSPLIGAAYHSTRAGAFHGDLNAYWMADRSGRVPFLFSFLRLAGVGTIQHTAASATPAMAWIEDCGTPTGDGKAGYTLGGGYPHTSAPSEPVNEPETMVRTYNAAWTRSWRGSTIVTDFLHHGYYGGLQRYSMAGFPAQMATDLAGATIQKVEIYLDNQHWWSSAGGTALIGRSTATSAPASPQTSGGAAFAATGWPVGQARWVTAPAGWWSATHRAITLGEGAGTSTTNYGKFANALSAVKLRVTYTK